jgi:hypothetical protein
MQVDPNPIGHALLPRTEGTEVSYCDFNPQRGEPMHLFVRILWACFFVIANGIAGDAAQPRPDLGWQTYSDREGTHDDIPARLFVVRTGPSDKGVGEQWNTNDGRARLSIYVLRNVDGLTPASYLRRYLTDAPSEIDYKRVTRAFFAVSKIGGDRVFYRRCNFAEAIHCIELAYPKREKRAWDAIVTRISRSLRPLNP